MLISQETIFGNRILLQYVLLTKQTVLLFRYNGSFGAKYVLIIEVCLYSLFLNSLFVILFNHLKTGTP